MPRQGRLPEDEAADGMWLGEFARLCGDAQVRRQLGVDVDNHLNEVMKAGMV